MHRLRSLRVPDPSLDIIAIGRASVDLYGQQIGARLEDMASFAKSVGGCPANIAIGAARLGLRSALVTRVGDEAFGRFIREQLAREGVDVRGVAADPKRLTALAILGVRDSSNFPLIFYREDCADAALDETDIDEDFIRSAGAIVVTGTHFARENSAAAQRKAMRIAREAGRRVIFDIDYRPNLWGLAGHGSGEQRYIPSGEVSAHLQTILPDCDLIVGTEEEVHIAGGTDDTLSALRRIRALSAAAIVLKRGPMGCAVFTGAIPASLEDGIKGSGFPVEVYNVLGAGDGFMSGLLRGYLRGEPWETTCAYANACGAILVSRLLCSPESPSWTELRHFLDHGSPERALRRDRQLAHLHWATTRRPGKSQILALAIDHRSQLEALADRCGAPRERLSRLKVLAVEAAARVSRGRGDIGMLIDDTHGREALFAAEGADLWIGRPVETPGSRPLTFEPGADLGSHLVEWPVTHTVKCLCFYHPDDPPALREAQEERLLALADAARTVGREYLVEIIAGPHGPLGPDTVAAVLRRLYAIGIKPDWWKLEPQMSAAAWQAIDAAIAKGDPYCRGVVLLGLEASEAELGEAFAAARGSACVKGFAVGRTIFAEPAEAWLSGRMDDAAIVDEMHRRFIRLIAAWEQAGR
ncbi:bifunctional 5-dehydro-2-deoxygluconokinase/5-dehydro-2-deoxyphosphogluconate aldolase [Rhodomicrobium vannielii]|uniref:bifunctional 5-dehydro-2-deoxygluconokinase/5-dehydro-2- deoxyphosphogluconate aldolase n=1 Tax=Rhodomicrobium vannielii TaxID=1069 RepID=UPI003D7C2C9E